MEYTLIRSNRKTLCVQISPEGKVIVRAPRRCPRGYVDQFVRSKAAWIQEHQAMVQNMLAQRENFSFQTGDCLPFCGRDLTVKIAPHCRVYLTATAAYLPRGDVKRIRKPLLAACQKAAYPWLKERLDGWAGRMGLAYRELKISTAKRRWGSCSRDGVIRISAYLLLAPEGAIDYVLVHELAHRRVFDHSRAFWAVVEAYIPDWKYWRGVLRDVQQRLSCQGFYE